MQKEKEQTTKETETSQAETSPSHEAQDLEVDKLRLPPTNASQNGNEFSADSPTTDEDLDLAALRLAARLLAPRKIKLRWIIGPQLTVRVRKMLKGSAQATEGRMAE